MIPFHIPTPQGCDIKIFYGAGNDTSSPNTNDAQFKFSWVKPVGVSHVYMMLIGGGGAGEEDTGTGGGSGVVTVWYGAAQHVPNKLDMFVRGDIDVNAPTQVSYTTTSGTPHILLTANSANVSVGGTAMTANQFTASGFFQSVAGQDGSLAGANVSPSATTFLSGGGFNSVGVTATANYGYTTKGKGFFQMQPIIVGIGSILLSSTNTAVGCGAAYSGVSGGQGMALIASW